MKRQNLVLGVALGAAIIASSGGGGAAFAGVTVDVLEVGGDVVTTGSGSWDLSGWTFDSSVSVSTQMYPSEAWLFTGASADADLYFAPLNFAGPANGFGTGGVILASSGTGDIFGMTLPGRPPSVAVATGYVDGDPLSGDATYSGQSFVSLGLTEGVYTWTWDTADGQGDFFTINVGPIPAPGAIALLGMAGLVSPRNRRRRRA